ncbi:MAG: pantetheine-phosphate adenylyltransferase, partial [Omnitrophica WOR_2 bacterium RBG_13_44_8b]
AMIKKATAGIEGVRVVDFKGLVVDFAHKQKAKVLIRGLRMISDFEYEFQMALTNRKLSPDVETIFLMPQESYCYLSAKLLKEAASLGADLTSFVPDFVQRALKRKLSIRS